MSNSHKRTRKMCKNYSEMPKNEYEFYHLMNKFFDYVIIKFTIEIFESQLKFTPKIHFNCDPVFKFHVYAT